MRSEKHALLIIFHRRPFSLVTRPEKRGFHPKVLRYLFNECRHFLCHFPCSRGLTVPAAFLAKGIAFQQEMEPSRMTHQPVVRLETVDLLHLLLIYPHLDQCYWCKQGQHHRRCWDGGQAFVAWELLVMGAEVETDLALDYAVDQQAQHGQHR